MRATFTTLTFLFFTTIVIAQEAKKEVNTEFKIAVIQTTDSLLLNCDHGCHWHELGFTYQEGDLFIIDQSGGGNVQYDEDGNISYDKDLMFSFTLQPRNSFIEMQGLNGTLWAETSVSTSEVKPAFIDNSGVSISSN